MRQLSPPITRQCATCGAPFLVSGTGRRALTCSPPCKAARRRVNDRKPPITRNCETCGTAFPVSGKGSNKRQHCSEPCRIRARRRRHLGSRRRPAVAQHCGKCGTAFTVSGWGLNRRYCSEPCRDSAARAKSRRRYTPKPPVTRSCETCGTAFTVAGNGSTRLVCSRPCLRAQNRGYSRSWRRRNIDEVRRRNREAVSAKYYADPEYRLLRAQGSDLRKRVTSFEVVSPAAMWQEQNGRCYLCGGQMNPLPIYLSSRRYDPLVATIEHRIPISRGGTHDRENVSLAHAQCNLRKNAKTVEEYQAA